MYPKPCAGTCNRILRPGNTSKEDYPTSQIAHQAQGMCGACYRRFKRNPDQFALTRSKATTRLDRIRHDNNMRGLVRFLAARHQRLDRRSRV